MSEQQRERCRVQSVMRCGVGDLRKKFGWGSEMGIREKINGISRWRRRDKQTHTQTHTYTHTHTHTH